MNKRVYIDQSGFDSKLELEYGWTLVGQRCYGERTGKRRSRVSLIGAQRQNKPIAMMSFPGTCNRAVFHLWAREVLLPEIEKGDIVILDNASIHKSKYFIELIESVGATVLWLPPYSPDFNPIEKTWANIKRVFRRIKQSIDDLHYAVDLAVSNYMAQYHHASKIYGKTD